MVRAVGIEPTLLSELDFESSASTSSTTPASRVSACLVKACRGYNHAWRLTATSRVLYHAVMSSNLRQILAAFLILALAVIGFVLFSQYVQGFQPCELCLGERWPWYVVIALGVLGVVRPMRWILGLIAVALLVSAGLGVHHAGVELHWWAGPSACTSGNSGAESVEELRAMMMRQTQVVQCDAVSWTFFGLSMATYNALVSLIAAGSAILLYMRSPHAD